MAAAEAKRAGVFGAAALAVAGASSLPLVARLDRKLFDLINRGNGRPADRVFGGITETGSIAASAAAAAVLAAFGRRRAAAEALGAAGAMWLVGQGLKRVVRR